MQCRGINRKDCSQVTDFGNFGFQSLLRRLGVLEKKLKVGSAAPRRLSIFFPKPPTSGAGFETKISKVRHLRAVFTVNTPTLHSRVQSYSDKIRFFPIIATNVPVQFNPFHEIQVEKPEDDD